MAQSKRDQNRVTTMLVISNADGIAPLNLYADPVTHRLVTASSSGTINARTDARRDENRIDTLLAAASTGADAPVTLMGSSSTHGLFVED